MADFEVSSHTTKDVLVIALKGKMVLERKPHEVMKTVIDSLKEGHENFLIDLQEVKMIDSSGIGELFAIQHAVKEKGGTLRLLHLDDRVGKVLHMAQLHQMVEIYSNEKEALSSFA